MSKAPKHERGHGLYSPLYVQPCCPWTAEPGLRDDKGEVSFGLRLLPSGGKHLFEKKVAIFFPLSPLLSANQKRKNN